MAWRLEAGRGPGWPQVVGKNSQVQRSKESPAPLLKFAQALEAVTRRLEAGGVRVVAARGTITHNDKPHLAAALPADDRAALVAQAAKTYLDWYLLTRVRKQKR